MDYPSSPDVSLAYDAMNRRTNMLDGIGTTTWSYSPSGQLLAERGPFSSATVSSSYAARRRVALSLQQPTGAWTNGFGYDSAKRMSSVVSPAGTFGYSYAPSGVRHRPAEIALANSAVITNYFDSSARLLGTKMGRFLVLTTKKRKQEQVLRLWHY